MRSSQKLALAGAFWGGATEALTVDHLNTAIIAFGAGTIDGSDVYSGASDGATVGALFSLNGGQNFSYTTMGEQTGMAIPLSTAGGADDSGVVVGGCFGVGYSMDKGATWHPAKGLSKDFTPGPSTPLQTQDVKYEKAAGTWAVTGQFFGKPGVALAPTADADFTVVNVPPELLVEPYVRYGAVPEKGTIFVTAGDWVEDDEAKPEAKPEAKGGDKRRMFKGLSVGKDGKARRLAALKEEGGEKPTMSDFPWGQVLKSSDGGASWSVVYNDTNVTGLYANDISCYDKDTCVFVLDGTNTPFASVIASTTNGGADWTMYETESPAGPGNGLYTVRMVGPTEAWAAGSDGTAGRGAPEEGQLWHSTDLKTWEMFSVASNDGAIITGFAADPTNSFAYASGYMSNNLCSVLKFTF